MSKAIHLAKNTAIIALGRLSYKMVLLLLLPIYTRFLTPNEYGMVDLLVVYIGLLVPTLTMQMEMAVFRFLLDVRHSTKEQTRVITNATIISCKIFLPLLIVLIVIGLVVNFQHLWLAVLLTLATLCFNLTSQITRGLGNNKQYAIASILSSLALLIGAGVLIVHCKLGIRGMLLSMILANLVATWFLIQKLNLLKYIRRRDHDKSLQREMLKYSLPLVPNGLAWWVINASDRTIISVMLSTAANGVYATASKLSSVMTNVYAIFYMAWIESAALYINERDRDEFFSRVANLTISIFGFFGLFLIAVIPFVFSMMTGERFADAYNYVPLLILGVFLNIVVGIYSSIYVAKKLTRQVMNTSIIAGALNIILSAGLMPLFGVYAATIGTIVAFLAMAIYRHYDSKKIICIKYDQKLLMQLGLLFLVVSWAYYWGGGYLRMVALGLVVTAALFTNHTDLNKFKRILMKGF